MEQININHTNMNLMDIKQKITIDKTKCIFVENFFEILCDIIDEEEFWYINCLSPRIKIITDTNQLNDINNLINYKTYFFDGNLTNDELIKYISKILNESIILSSEYDIKNGRILNEMIDEYIIFDTFINNVKDYTKPIIWNIYAKSIENI